MDSSDSFGTASARAPVGEGAPAGASVVDTCLALQSTVPARGALARLFGVIPLTAESKRWYVRAVGESRVTDQLERLGAGWTVLHAVPAGERGRVIDHLAIGRGGVFAITVLHHEGKSIRVDGDELLVNGAPRTDIERARDEASDAAVALTRAARLNVPVHGLLAFVSPATIAIRSEPDDVAVATDRTLYKRLVTAGPAVDEGRVRQITDAAVERAVWRGATTLHRPHGGERAAFDALRTDVQRAWLARGLWICAAVAATLLTGLRFVAG